MKIIIAGDGKVGANLTRKLSAEGYDITLIDTNGEVLDASLERYDVMAVNGNCALMSVLSEAGVDRADVLIASTSADEINLLCCMTAHKMNPELHTIARIRNPEYSEQIYTMRDAFGLSLTVNPEKQTAVEIERLLKYPGFLQRETVDFCQKQGIIVEAWSPLGRGRIFDDPTLLSLANKYDKTVAQIALRWEHQHDIVVLPKTVTPSRMTENMQIFDFELSYDDMETLDGMDPVGASGHSPDQA